MGRKLSIPKRPTSSRSRSGGKSTTDRRAAQLRRWEKKGYDFLEKYGKGDTEWDEIISRIRKILRFHPGLRLAFDRGCFAGKAAAWAVIIQEENNLKWRRQGRILFGGQRGGGAEPPPKPHKPDPKWYYYHPKTKAGANIGGVFKEDPDNPGEYIEVSVATMPDNARPLGRDGKPEKDYLH